MSGTTAVVGTEGPGLVAVNGVRIAYTSTGSVGEPLVLVHGSWGSRHNWDPVIPGLAEHYRVVAYDRRGHSESERPRGQGSFTEDVADLAGLIEELDLAPAAWVAGNSAGRSSPSSSPPPVRTSCVASSSTSRRCGRCSKRAALRPRP
jgi:pimeloyl-ACP methyl ester carboxylesterase